MKKNLLLRILTKVYGFDEIINCNLIHKGINKVYKVQVKENKKLSQYACRVSKINPEHQINDVEFEHRLLGRLRERFPKIPIIVPIRSGEKKEALISQGNYAIYGNSEISIFPWVNHLKFSGSNSSLKKTGLRLAQMQKALTDLDLSGFEDKLIRKQFYLINFCKRNFKINRKFSFIRFREFIEKEKSEKKIINLIIQNLNFLEKNLKEVKTELDYHNEIIKKLPISIIHSDPSPNNFGYDSRGDVKIIFDFDFSRYGLRIQDTSWNISTFCIDYTKPIHEVTKKIKILISSMEQAFPLSVKERRLLLLFTKIRHLESIYRNLTRRYFGGGSKMNYIEKNINALKYIQKNFKGISSALLVGDPGFEPGTFRM